MSEVNSIIEKLHNQNALTYDDMNVIKSKDSPPEKVWTLHRIFLAKKKNLYNQFKAALRQSQQLEAANLLASLEQIEEVTFVETLEKPLATLPPDEIKYNPADLLNVGCFGSFVYRGTLGTRNVAVKVIFDSGKPGQVEMEINSLIKCEDHANVVKYYMHKHDPIMRQYMLAFELCVTTLEGHILKKETNSQLSYISHMQILVHIANGIVHLHQYGILHRDLNPSNILMVKKGDSTVVKIADFGISKWLVNERSSVTLTSAVGTEGYRPPEVLEYIDMGERQKKGKALKTLRKTIKCSSDIFSLGCIFYFVISGGNHPFGASTREISNNIHNKVYPVMDTIYDNPNGICLLIRDMVAHEAGDRPAATDIIAHHVFWSKQLQLEFLIEISALCKKNINGDVDFGMKKLESQCIKICSSEGWMTKIQKKEDSSVVYDYLSNNSYRKYKGTSVLELLRAIRNMVAHYRDLPTPVRKAFGDMPNGFINYWLSRYVYLVHHVWMSFQCSRHDQIIAKYYTNTYIFL